MKTTKEKTMKTKHVSRRLRRFRRSNEAVSALEYAILVGVIAVGVGAVIITFGDTIQNAITGIGTKVTATVAPLAPAPSP